jgi:hypothetical protein
LLTVFLNKPLAKGFIFILFLLTVFANKPLTKSFLYFFFANLTFYKMTKKLRTDDK